MSGLACLQVRYSASESEWLVLARERLKLNVAQGDLPSARRQRPPETLAVEAAEEVAASAAVPKAGIPDGTPGSDFGRGRAVGGSHVRRAAAEERGEAAEAEPVNGGDGGGQDEGKEMGGLCFQAGQLVWARVKGEKKLQTERHGANSPFFFHTGRPILSCILILLFQFLNINLNVFSDSQSLSVCLPTYSLVRLSTFSSVRLSTHSSTRLSTS